MSSGNGLLEGLAIHGELGPLAVERQHARHLFGFPKGVRIVPHHVLVDVLLGTDRVLRSRSLVGTASPVIALAEVGPAQVVGCEVVARW